MTAQFADHFATIAVIAAALLFAARRAWRAYVAARTVRDAGCGPNCGCE